MTDMQMETSNQQGIVAIRQLDTEAVQLIKETIAKEASDTELAMFIHQCNRTGLDPFARQIYLIERYNDRLKRNIRTTQTSIDGFRLIAQRSGDYAGQTPKYWCGDDGQWIDVWLSAEPPRAAKVGIYRRGFVEPLWAVATWDQYAVYNKGKDGKFYLGSIWKKMPALMLAKCAESLALRQAYPQELSGLYTDDEMGQAQNVPAPAPDQNGKRSAKSSSKSSATTTRMAPPNVDGAESIATTEQLTLISDALNQMSEDDRQAFIKFRTERDVPPPSRSLTGPQASLVYSTIIAFLDGADAVDAEIVSHADSDESSTNEHENTPSGSQSDIGGSEATVKKGASGVVSPEMTKRQYGMLRGLAKDIRGYETQSDAELLFSAVMKRPVTMDEISKAEASKLIDQLNEDKKTWQAGGALPAYGDRPSDETSDTYEDDEDTF